MGVVGLCCPSDSHPRKPADGCADRTPEQRARQRPCDGSSRQGLLGSGKARRGQRQAKRESGNLQRTHPVLSCDLKRKDHERLVSSPGR